jgi:hypothetical protein
MGRKKKKKMKTKEEEEEKKKWRPVAPPPSCKRRVQYDSTVRSKVRVGLTWPRTSCWPWNRFTRELRSLGERSSAARRGPTDTKAALAVRSGAKLKDERQLGGSGPTEWSSNKFPYCPGGCGLTEWSNEFPYGEIYTLVVLVLQNNHQISLLTAKVSEV